MDVKENGDFQMKNLMKVVLTSTHNICFRAEIRKSSLPRYTPSGVRGWGWGAVGEFGLLYRLVLFFGFRISIYFGDLEKKCLFLCLVNCSFFFFFFFFFFLLGGGGVRGRGHFQNWIPFWGAAGGGRRGSLKILGISFVEGGGGVL